MIPELVAATTSAVDLAKAIKAGVEKYEDAEMKMQMADLLSILADAKLESAAAANKVAELESQLNFIGDTEFDGEVYWRKTEEQAEGPFCQRCLDVDRLAVRLQSRGVGGYHCKQCNSSYGSANGQPRFEARVKPRRF